MAKEKETTYNEEKEAGDILGYSGSGEKAKTEEKKKDKKEDIIKPSGAPVESDKPYETIGSEDDLPAVLPAQAGGKKSGDSSSEIYNKTEEKEEVEEEKVAEDKKGKFAGEAMFQKGTNNKTNLILVVVIVVVVALVLFARTDAGENILATLGIGESTVSEKVKYVNPVHGYSFEFESDENSQLVVAGNIPVELEFKGIESMQDLDLTDGDALLIRTDTVSEDSIVYTILELSKRDEYYTTFDEYLENLRINLGQTTQAAGTGFTEKETVVGKDRIPAVEFSFEMDVLINQESLEKRVGVFYDTIFEAGDNSYRIAFGYPKNIENAQYYINLYRDLVASFTYGEEIELISDDSDSVETEEAEEMGNLPSDGEDKGEIVE